MFRAPAMLLPHESTVAHEQRFIMDAPMISRTRNIGGNAAAAGQTAALAAGSSSSSDATLEQQHVTAAAAAASAAVTIEATSAELSRIAANGELERNSDKVSGTKMGQGDIRE